jgi:adenosylcobinamide-GDP ribazoletransferase
MLLAPLIGLLLAVVIAAVVAALRWVAQHSEPVGATTGIRDLATDLIGAVVAVALLAWFTRGLHLDGLADVADGLGVKGAGPATRVRRLEVMHQPDVGAFGAITVVLLLLLQISALLLCIVAGHGSLGLIVAVVTGRLAITWACRRGVPSARSDGLGAAVAESTPLVAVAAITVAVAAMAFRLGQLYDGGTLRLPLSLIAAVLVGLAVAVWFQHRCVRAFGGITGDVLGASVEVATAAALLTVALTS